ncbi:nuclear transport factor 2 family protein [Mycobacterium asiaticum]|uniref:nuclear transport factor 2 family protein n=1 Tax=Mycobacterium asiaticum TaxID=1790 RepID=UPI00055C5236|nr:nuclear transport factor 2 family protein [Mycobacterium asiaticum]ORA11129.1 hypothetical protein BST16_20245 [Mycobacterium asiaticum DSM 44297]
MAMENLHAVEAAYSAFSAGDLESVASIFDSSVEWNVYGDSAIGGLHKGRAAVAELLGRVAQKLTYVEPKRFFTDGDSVVVLAELRFEADVARQADVYQFQGGRVVNVRTFGDAAVLQRVFGVRQAAVC